MIQYAVINLSWEKEDKFTFLPILFSLFLFEIFWFASKSGKLKSLFYKNKEFDNASATHITFFRIFGFIIMGFVSAALCLIFMPDYSLADYGFTYNADTTLFTVLWTSGLAVIGIPLAFISARKPKNHDNYPQIRAKFWTKKIIFMNAFGWAVYLLGYEFLFRGVLLFPLAEHLGVWTAVAVNIALCSATHIPKGLDETLGAIILAVILSLLTLASGTIWIAFFVHLTLALTNSFTALKFHPDMYYLKNEK